MSLRSHPVFQYYMVKLGYEDKMPGVKRWSSRPSSARTSSGDHLTQSRSLHDGITESRSIQGHATQSKGPHQQLSYSTSSQDHLGHPSGSIPHSRSSQDHLGHLGSGSHGNLPHSRSDHEVLAQHGSPVYSQDYGQYSPRSPPPVYPKSTNGHAAHAGSPNRYLPQTGSPQGYSGSPQGHQTLSGSPSSNYQTLGRSSGHQSSRDRQFSPTRSPPDQPLYSRLPITKTPSPLEYNPYSISGDYLSPNNVQGSTAPYYSPEKGGNPGSPSATQNGYTQVADEGLYGQLKLV